MSEEVLRDFGPQDPDDVAELVPRVGVHNKASQVIQAVRDAYPREYVTAASKPPDKGRTDKLDMAEVTEVAANVLGEDFDEVTGAAVRGPKDGTPEQMHVIITYAVPGSGRTARAALSYHTFESSQRAYDRAVASGDLVPGGEEDSNTLQQMLRQKEAEIRRLQSEQGAPAETITAEDVAKIVADAETRIREELAAEAETAAAEADAQAAEDAEAEASQTETETPVAEVEEGEEFEEQPPVFDDSELIKTEGEPVLGYAESLSADDLVQRIEGGHYDAAQISAIQATEAGGKGRKTVLAAVEGFLAKPDDSDQPPQG